MKRLDLLIALGLTVSTQIELWTNDRVEEPFAVQVAAFCLITIPLAWRRTAPVAATAVVSAGFAAQTILAGDAPVLGGLVAAILITYAAGAYTDGRAAWVALAFVQGGIVLSALWDPDKRGLADAAGNVLIFAVIWALGRLVRARQDRADTLEVSVAEQRERAERAAADERARIARELHDVIAHNVSLMVLQAGAARHVLDQDPARVRDPLLTIERSGRETIAEMRRLLGILRTQDGPLSLAPQPGIDQLGELADAARRSGLVVDLTVERNGRPLTAGHGLAAYRIVQEALTNTIKHAGATRVDVCVRSGREALAIEVADDGHGGGPGGGGGHGLVGMRERVALYGGTLTAAPAPGGGFRVAARLPLDEDAR